MGLDRGPCQCPNCPRKLEGCRTRRIVNGIFMCNGPDKNGRNKKAIATSSSSAPAAAAAAAQAAPHLGDVPSSSSSAAPPAAAVPSSSSSAAPPAANQLADAPSSSSSTAPTAAHCQAAPNLRDAPSSASRAAPAAGEEAAAASDYRFRTPPRKIPSTSGPPFFPMCDLMKIVYGLRTSYPSCRVLTVAQKFRLMGVAAGFAEAYERHAHQSVKRISEERLAMRAHAIFQLAMDYEGHVYDRCNNECVKAEKALFLTMLGGEADYMRR
jgi:hypothetical protein